MHAIEVEIRSRDYWFKIVDFLQQNWALIKEGAGGGCTVFFFGETSGVFDQLRFPSVAEAEVALLRNGFKRYDTDEKAKEFIGKPEPPFWESRHPNGPIYSSGRYWSRGSGGRFRQACSPLSWQQEATRMTSNTTDTVSMGDEWTRTRELAHEIAAWLRLERAPGSAGQSPKIDELMGAFPQDGSVRFSWQVPHANGYETFCVALRRHEARMLAIALLRWAEQDERVEQLRASK